MAGFIGSLNWTFTLALRGTLVALGAGVLCVIVGAVVSAPVA